MTTALIDGDLEIGKIWIGKHGYPVHGNDTLVHRTVMEKHLGRKLTTVERVHHRNRNRLDARLHNLALCANDAEHKRLHMVEDCRRAGYDHFLFKWCSYHQRYEHREGFSYSHTQYDGLHNNCREATNEYRKLTGLNRGKFDWKARMNQQFRRAMKAGACSLLQEGSCQ